MNASYSYAEWTATEPSLAERYDSADPVTWKGANVYPLHSVNVGACPTTVTLNLRATGHRRGVRGMGIGLTVDGGHVLLNDRQMHGVDVWSDAMSGGIELRVCPTGADAAITVTPVWMDEHEQIVSWSGNYGMLITRERACTVLHCSTGVGPADFTELVVEVSTAPTPADPIPPADAGRYCGALYDLGVAMHHRGEEHQACELWRQAAALGHPSAAYDLAVVLLRYGALAEAEQWWRAAADNGDMRAMAGLAEVLDRRGNPSEARIWRASLATENGAY